MSRADYAHWNEDADWMWWQEEGRHIEEPPYLDDDEFFDDDYDDCLPEGTYGMALRDGNYIVVALEECEHPDGECEEGRWYCTHCLNHYLTDVKT